VTTIRPAGAAYRGARVQLDLVTLAADTSARVVAPDGDEAVVVLLAGDAVIAGHDARRRSVFEDRATAVYLPPGAAVDVSARTPVELALAATVGAALAPRGAAVFVGPGDVVVHDRGRPGWRREVHDVVVEQVDAHRLLVGETRNAPGEWSSFPPHKHDGTDGEPALEEVYYHRFDSPDGFGFQGLYGGGEERAVFLRHGTVVGFDRGYHPVCAAPGYRLYYLWALAGAPRRLAMHEDPAHTWLH
jgi:5-deoxy-glucuronate isomerase